MALLALGQLIQWIFASHPAWPLAEPRYWVFPLQTVVCGALLFRFRHRYALQLPKSTAFTIAIALIVFALWICPQALLGLPRRLEGFDPGFFGPTWFWPNLLARFVRLVIVVPLAEEIFWRGFLLRYLAGPNFGQIPIGHFQWSSFLWVTALFGLAHQGPDLVPAIATGALYNWVACRTKSLGSCVLAHAFTNLLLGIYILHTGQWGFW